MQSAPGAAASAELCWVNREGQVSYRESTKQQKKPVEPKDPGVTWNKFVTLPRFDSSNAYDVLNAPVSTTSKGHVAKVKKEVKKADEVPVLDNWESFEV